jgi:hypothetical protein
MKSILQRAGEPTPKFFKKLRTIGLAIAAIGATILAAPVALPAIVIKIGGYLAVAGSVMSGVSQVTVKKEESDE